MEDKGLSMGYLMALMQKLSAAEVKNLKLYLKCFDPNFNDQHRVKTLQLLECLESNHLMQEEEVLLRIYPDGDRKKFAFLLLRLTDKIYESLLLEVNIGRNENYAEASRVGMDLKKKLILAQILWSRDLTERLNHLLEKVIRKARQYELYTELTEALLLKQQLEGLKRGITAFNELQAEVDEAHAALMAVRRARQFYSMLALKGVASAHQGWDLAFLQAAVTELQATWEATHSETVRFYLHLVQLTLLQQQGRYEEGTLLCHSLIDLLQGSAALRSQRRLGIAFSQLAENELFEGAFAQAILHARESQRCFPLSGRNRAAGIETEFYALFHSGKFAQAVELLQPLLSPEMEGRDPLAWQRRAFLMANALFQCRQFGEAQRWLRLAGSMLHDKAGWNVGIRILDILIQIERRQMDGIELQLDAMRKHLGRLQDAGACTRRPAVILKLLNCLARANYDFERTARAHREELDQLSCDEEGLRWKIKGPEMVPFQDWFWGKVKAEVAS